MTRIAFLCADAGIPYGGTKGASVHAEELTRALAAVGAEVRVMMPVIAPGTVAPAGVEVEILPHLGRGVSVERHLEQQDALEEHLVERLSAWRADIVYERFALHSAAGSRAARALGLAHLVELNAPLPWEATKFRRLDAAAAAHALEREVLTHSDAVLPVTRPLERYAADRGARRTIVVPNAATPRDDGDRSGLDKRTPRAVFAGTLRAWHGVEAIAGAWRRLGESAPELVVIGDGPGRELIESVGGRVLGMVAPGDVPALLEEATIGLVPFARDAPDYFSPLKLFAYMAAGLAVVAGRLPGVVDVVKPGTAVLIEPGDSAALADTVAGLAADPVRCAALGGAARRLIASSHTWRHRARTVIDVGSALQRARAGPRP